MTPNNNMRPSLVDLPFGSNGPYSISVDPDWTPDSLDRDLNGNISSWHIPLVGRGFAYRPSFTWD